MRLCLQLIGRHGDQSQIGDGDCPVISAAVAAKRRRRAVAECIKLLDIFQAALGLRLHPGPETGL